MMLPAPLQRPDFRSVWTAGLISDTGDWLLFVALPVVVYQLTGSALGTSFAFLVELLPGIVLAPLVGRLVDRCERRRLMLVVTLLQAVALLPLLLVHTRSDLPVLYTVIVVEATLMAIFDPAKNALLPTLLPPEDLVAGNALVGLNQNLGRLVGGPAGGVLLAVAGLRLTVAADVISYLLAAALIARLRARVPAEPDSGALELRTGSGGSFVGTLRNPASRPTLIVVFAAQIAQGMFVVVFVLFVAERLGGGSAEIGLLRGIQAIGAIGASLVLTAMARRFSAASLVTWAAAAIGALSLAAWNSPYLTTGAWLYIVLFIAVGAPGVVLMTGIISNLQLATAPRERGRAFSALNLVGNTGQAVGMILAGALVAPLGLMSVLDAQGLLYLAAAAVAARWLVAVALRPHPPATLVAPMAVECDGAAMPRPPDGLPTYRLLTGRDDEYFCRRVSEALALGFELHEGPAVAYDGSDLVVAQALTWPSQGQ